VITRSHSETVLLSDADVLSALPTGSAVEHLIYKTERDANSDVVLEFPEAIHCFALRERAETSNEVHLNLLTVPLQLSGLSEQEQSEILALLRRWVEAVATPKVEPSQMMTLQGTLVVWAPRRVAVLVPPDRLAEVRKAVIEVSYYERELREIETHVGQSWPTMNADIPLAFESQNLPPRQRKLIRQRFEMALRFRARLTRIAAQVHCPHAHPPTLASQVGERFRDRARLAHRYEFLSDQLEVLEEIYEKCSERANEFRLTQSSNTLEWIIIILLVMQIVLWGFEILTSMSP
jgi:hypothetical protein